jgi:hypothetical protein
MDDHIEAPNNLVEDWAIAGMPAGAASLGQPSTRNRQLTLHSRWISRTGSTT